MKFDLSPYFLVPFSQMDCFDLIEKIYSEKFNLDISFLKKSEKDESLLNKKVLKEVKFSECNFGDILVFKSHVDLHLGMYVDPVSFFHTSRRTQYPAISSIIPHKSQLLSCFTRVSFVLASKIVEIFAKNKDFKGHLCPADSFGTDITQNATIKERDIL